MGQGPSHHLPTDDLVNGPLPPLSYIQYEANRNFCLSVSQFPPVDGAELILRDCTDEGTLNWRYEAIQKAMVFDYNGEFYCLQSTHRNHNGAAIVIGQCDGGHEEQWTYSGSYQNQHLTAGDIFINNYLAGSIDFCLDNKHGMQQAGNQVYGWDCRGKKHHQRWNIISDPRESQFTPTLIRYEANSDYCLGLESFPAFSGTKTMLQHCGEPGTQNWDYIAETEQIIYQFQGQSLCLNAHGWHSSWKSLDLVLQPCADSNHQNLKRDHMGRIYTPNMKQHGLTGPRYCIDNTRGNHVNGNKVNMYLCHGDHNGEVQNQQWSFETLSEYDEDFEYDSE
eukprot:Pgem_evm1s2859